MDTSALAKLYQVETGTPRIDSISQNALSRIGISRLTVVEMRSSFALKVRSGAFTKSEGMILIQRFVRDVSSNRFEISRAADSDFEAAGRLLERYGFDLRLRTLDAIQLAVAVKRALGGRLDYFVAADRVLCEVAALEGLAVINPDES